MTKSSMRSLHIGISALHVRPGLSGSHEPYMVQLVRAIHAIESQHQFTLFVTPANRKLFPGERPGFKVITAPYLAEDVGWRIVFEQLWLPLLARQLHLDVMHYPGTSGSVFLRPKDVVTIHQDPITQTASMSLLKKAYFHLLLPLEGRAGRVISPSQVYSRQLAAYYGIQSEKLSAVYHGVTPAFRSVDKTKVEAVRQKWGIREQAILSVTNTLPHKNVLNLVRAFEILRCQDGGDQVQFVLVGDVKPDILDSFVAEFSGQPAKLRDQILLIPFLPNDELPPIYAASKVFTFVSLAETFGMPLVEAMACGLPVVASDLPVHREVLNGVGRLVNPRDPRAIADGLQQTLNASEAQRQQWVRAGFERSQDFSWEITARKTIEVYQAAFLQGRA